MRKAIIIASNGPEKGPPQLRFAKSDGQRISNVLSQPRCCFEVTIAPTSRASDTRETIYNVAADCKPEDTLLIYFAGHGIVESTGLHLLLDNTTTERILATGLPAADLMYAMRSCKAQSRILILDCCNAGQIVRQSGIRSGASDRIPMQALGVESDTFDIILASDTLELAREMDEKHGGFFTWALCDALSESFSDADVDKDRAISVEDAMRWLERRALEFNRSNLSGHQTVPVPRRLGVGRGQAFITLPPQTWSIYEVPFPDGIPAIILPLRPIGKYAFALGRHPVTNIVYERNRDQDAPDPIGKEFRNGRWSDEAFEPWRSTGFKDEESPVVCVNYEDALTYCRALLRRQRGSELTWRFLGLPLAPLWDYAALGSCFPSQDPSVWAVAQRVVHCSAQSPAPCTNAPERGNANGLTDMIGNVWEWCSPLRDWRAILKVAETIERDKSTAGNRVPDLIVHGWMPSFRTDKDLLQALEGNDGEPELRGGSFYDDIYAPKSLEPYNIYDGRHARHADLGFRVAGLIPCSLLPQELNERLAACVPLEVRWPITPRAA